FVFFFKRRLNSTFEIGLLALVPISAARLPLRVAFSGDLFHAVAGLHRFLLALFLRPLHIVDRFPYSSFVLFHIAPRNPNQRPFALRLVACQNQMELSLVQGFKRLLAVNVIFAPVPKHHRSTPVLTLGNDSLERAIFDWMIFHFDGEMFLTFGPWQSFG